MATKDIEIVEPSGAKMGPVINTFHVPGKWGVHVSFGNITFQEGDAVADATGFLAYKNGLHHCAGAGGTNKCSPLPVGPGDLSAGSRAGSKVNVLVYQGLNDPSPTTTIGP